MKFLSAKIVLTKFSRSVKCGMYITITGTLMERHVVLVAVLITASTGGGKLGLCIRDSTGEIPCEVSESGFSIYAATVF